MDRVDHHPPALPERAVRVAGRAFVDNAARWFLGGIIVSLINTAVVLVFIGVPGVTGDGDSEIEVVEVPRAPVQQVLVVGTDGQVLLQRTNVSEESVRADLTALRAAIAAELGAVDASVEGAVADAVAEGDGETAPEETVAVVEDPPAGGDAANGDAADGESGEAGEDGTAAVEATPEPVPTPEPPGIIGPTFQRPRFVEVQRPGAITAQQGVAFVATLGELALSRVAVVDGERQADEVELDGIEELEDTVIVGVDVIRDGTLYLLLSDGPFEWRLYRRELDEEDEFDTLDGGEWELATSGEIADWPGTVEALSVADSGAIYLSMSEPAGLYRIEPTDLDTVRQWVPRTAVAGIDVRRDDGRLLYVVPRPDPAEPELQIRQVRSGRYGAWHSTYGECAGTALGPVPFQPRDLAIYSANTMLVLDSGNHVLWLQEERGEGRAIAGTACFLGQDALHLRVPRAVAVDEGGVVYLSDTGNDRVAVLIAER